MCYGLQQKVKYEVMTQLSYTFSRTPSEEEEWEAPETVAKIVLFGGWDKFKSWN